MQQVFADLHVHIGRDKYNKPVKITASNKLTITNILEACSTYKGIQLIGAIDCQSPAVLEEIQDLIREERAVELDNGGIRYGDTTLILGSEIEIQEQHYHGPMHVLCYLPTLESMWEFSTWLNKQMKNITLSTQRFYGTAAELQEKVKELNGIFIPAHVFTPFKSLYGKAVKARLTEVLAPDKIDAIELGLSSDTQMADQISELHKYPYVSNSDAHSIAKIAREYQAIQMEEISFKGLQSVLSEQGNNRVLENYGMNPLLGKYHYSVCTECFTPAKGTNICRNCGSTHITKGVSERIDELSDYLPAPKRPDYVYQVPLEYLKGLGPKAYQGLIDAFRTEMNIIHHVTEEDLLQVTTKQIAEQVIALRKGELLIQPGGGGKYGKLK